MSIDTKIVHCNRLSEWSQKTIDQCTLSITRAGSKRMFLYYLLSLSIMSLYRYSPFFISHTLSPLTHYAMAVIDSKFSALRWDELVPDDRLLKWTDTNLQKQQQLRDMHIRRKTPRSSSSRSSTQQDTTSESRGRKRHRDSTTDKPRTVRLSFLSHWQY